MENKTIKIEIKNRLTGSIIFSYEKENNTMRDTVEEAVKNNANLRYANLENANLENANLRYANLENANLENANLENANLRYANLENANLENANLENANLRYANLRYANLENANLENANLENANLENANLEKDKFPIHKFNFLPEGDIIGWKIVHGNLIKLLIPKEAKRVHAISSRKCRAEFAQVLEIQDGLIEIVNTSYTPHCTYKLGEIVKPDSFNDCWLTECGNGINFFINKQEAIEY